MYTAKISSTIPHCIISHKILNGDCGKARFYDWLACLGDRRLLLLEITFPDELNGLSEGILVATKQCTALTSWGYTDYLTMLEDLNQGLHGLFSPVAL